ncbi:MULTISPECIES: DEAD/DEAH box helicase family protein [unclassified Streptomyces]|uniref:DEAD/DEAH box helicase family protein n=1 Tax=unclassified Streptomyces TaxID=2593676 RepID=UPI0003A0F118|nr:MULTISPECIES: DEAD/DEAH box helicase family protein [unclassified Streptomyces]MYT31710.1 DEAD/DEAH box helicase family protein [Streptomyces sp. SID8354]
MSSVEPEWARTVEAALTVSGWQVYGPGERELGVAHEAVRSPVSSALVLFTLYVHRRPCGIVAAGPPQSDQQDLFDTAAEQAARIAIRHGDPAWRGALPLPFHYAVHGSRWFFRNLLDAELFDGTVPADAPEGGARSRPIFAPHRPDTVARWLRDAERYPGAPTLRARMRALPDRPLVLRRRRGLPGLRPAQYRAVQGLERSFAQGDQRALIQMATGAGKTYAAVESTYRMLQHAGARRVLFLVDRHNLGGQARDEYRGYTPFGSRKTLHEQLPLRHFTKGDVAESDRIVISTIQRLWCKISGVTMPDPEDEEFETRRAAKLAGELARVGYREELPPDFFDVIIVDECHRSIYGRWRPVLEYFDAHIVGLTATPVQETFGFFRNLVAQYTQQEAVADGVNVDYDVYKITTRITLDGATIPKTLETRHPDGTLERLNSVINKIHKDTRAEHWHTMAEDDPYAPAEINHRVRSADQIRTIVNTFRDKLFTEIFPPVADRDTGEIRPREIVPKTLIFAQNELHADAIVTAVQEAFGAGDKFCRKITSKAARPKKALNDFRTKRNPRIAVTVDMIATGTDVPALECLVFMRDIQSWSYFEQMKGRGARSIEDCKLRAVTRDAVHKDRFVIVDAVGITEHPKTDSRPLVRDDEAPVPSLERLLQACGERRALHRDDAATLAGRLSRLGQRLDEAALASIEELLGEEMSYEGLVGGLVRAADTNRREEARARGDAVPDEIDDLAAAARPLVENEALRAALLEAARDRWLHVDHINQDSLVEARGLQDEEEARQVVTDWRAYIAEHENEILPLRISFQERRPPGEVLAALRDLVASVRATRPEWTEARIWKAYVDLGVARGGRRRGAGLVELLSVMRFELGLDGDEFRPYRSTVEDRLEAWLARQETAGVTFDEQQLMWLRMVVDVVAANATVSVSSLNEGPRLHAGGFGAFVDAFEDSRWTPGELVDELDRELGA